MKIPYKSIILLCLVFTAGKSYALCTASTIGVNFGAYDVFQATNNNSTGSITITCTSTTNVTVNLSISTYSGVFNPRQMKKAGGPDLMNYNLFVDPARLNIWGNGTAGTFNVNQRVRRNFPATFTAYGSIPAGQDLSAGLYSDTLTVTVLP